MIASLRNVSKTYRKGVPAYALSNLTLAIQKGERLMIAGESGSGKSTLGRCLANWESPDEGEVEWFDGVRSYLVPQEPGGSLNPYWTALDLVAEPYRIQGTGQRTAHASAKEWIARVELPSNCGNKRRHQFSGGEQARLAIARTLAALSTDPGGAKLLIFDESFSALDELLRVRILDLLMSLQSSFSATYVLLSHDLAITAKYVDRIAVLEAGRIVECGDSEQVLNSPVSDTMSRLVAESKALS